MIHELLNKVKRFYEGNKQDLFIAAIIFLVGLGSFGLGRLSVIWPKKEPITFTEWGNPLEREKGALEGQNQAIKGGSASPIGGAQASQNTASALNPIIQGKYVASKKGTAYHYPWCPGAKQIKEENKIYFDTKEEAEKAGYKPAGNCEGL